MGNILQQMNIFRFVMVTPSKLLFDILSPDKCMTETSTGTQRFNVENLTWNCL